MAPRVSLQKATDALSQSLKLVTENLLIEKPRSQHLHWRVSFFRRQNLKRDGSRAKLIFYIIFPSFVDLRACQWKIGTTRKENTVTSFIHQNLVSRWNFVSIIVTKNLSVALLYRFYSSVKLYSMIYRRVFNADTTPTGRSTNIMYLTISH